MGSGKVYGWTMYGMIHTAARSMVKDQLGDATWAIILEKSGLNEEHFITAKHYSDETTLSVIACIVETTGIESQELLRKFGQYWIGYATSSAYRSVFTLSGSTLDTFLTNLNRMHMSVSRMMPEASMPVFEMVPGEPGVTDIVYRSDRGDLLLSFVEGLLIGLMAYFEVSGTVQYRCDAGEHVFRLHREAARHAA